MNYKLLSGKHLLLDTNVLINYANYAPFLEEMRLELQAVKAIPVLDELVRFEFLREAASPAETKSLKKFLKILFDLDDTNIDTSLFPLIPEDTIACAIEIANIYSQRAKNLKISLVDCFLAAQMKKYNEKKEQLFLATSDHTDFPNLFFERIGIETIDTGEKILNIGFYRFDAHKFHTCRAEYSK